MGEAARKRAALTGISDGELADRWGKLKRAGDAYDQRIEDLKAEFDRRGLDVARGEAWKVIKDVQTQNRFDAAAAKADLGEAAKKYLKEQKRTSYLVRPVEEAA